jgi:hypothetical protein
MAIYAKKTYVCRRSIVVTVRGGAAVARRAHNPKVAGSTPAPATTCFVAHSGVALIGSFASFLRGMF